MKKRYLYSWPKASLLAGSLVLLILAMAMSGCVSSQASSRQDDKEKNASLVVPVGSLLENPKAYDGREVSISGKITTECGSGCWFFLDDGSGTVYVDTKPGNFAIPQLPGRTVRVKGTITSEGGDVAILATMVESGGKVYQ
jgi:uncharacterized protein YdeI (BOF family)